MINSIEKRFIWLNGDIVNVQNANVNVLSPTSQFGANVFEGIRCYWNEKDEQLYAFRIEEHYVRLENSIKMFRMEQRYSKEEMRSGLLEVVKAENYREDIAVRQTVFIDGFGSWMSQGPTGMFIAPIPKKCTLSQDIKGLRCCISSWERISDRNLSPKVKVGANYINSRMAQMEALQNGYDSAILLNDNGKLSEGPGSCLFLVRNGKLLTPDISSSVLESITRDTIIRIAKDILDIEVVEREIDRTELYICDEAFLCGSAMEITPIQSVDGISIKDGRVGEITNVFRNTYLEVLRGEIEGFTHWLTPIY